MKFIEVLEEGVELLFFLKDQWALEYLCFLKGMHMYVCMFVLGIILNL